MADHGSFYWNELMTGDPEQALAFYGAVVGWDSRTMNMGDGASYTILRSAGRDVGGMFRMEGPESQGAPPMWMAYVCVDDVDAAVAKVEGAGGAVHKPPFDVPGVGRIAMIADPGGAMLGLMTPAAGD